MARTKKTTSPTTLYGDLVTPENMAALAGVGVDDFPINLPFHNRTSSAMAFPELGIDLPAYAENVDVLILEKGGVSLFCMNYGYLSKLFGWNDKVGVFATRSMYRPSAIGLSVVRLSKVEICHHSVRLHIIGADMVDGTPIVDIKPYLPFVDSVPDAVSGEIDVPMTKTVAMTTQASTDFDMLCQDGRLAMIDKSIIQHLIAQDPRVAYRQAEIEVVSTMRYGAVDVDFWMDEMGMMVITGLRAVDE